jgi:hypothetical protein
VAKSMTWCMRRRSSLSEVDDDDAPAQNRCGEGVPSGRRRRATYERRVHVVRVLGGGRPHEEEMRVWGRPNGIHAAWRGMGTWSK